MGHAQTLTPTLIIRAFDPALATYRPGCPPDVADKTYDYFHHRDPSDIDAILTPGETPDRYWIVPATIKGRRYIQRGESALDICERAFAVCVSKVEMADGKVYTHPKCDGVHPAGDAFLELFGHDDILDIGHWAWRMSTLGKGVPPYSQLLPTSELACRALWRRLVGPTSGPEPSSPPSSEQAAAPEPGTPTP